MHTNKYLKKRTIIFIISIIFVLLCILIFLFVNNQNDINNLIETDVKNIEVIYDTDNKSLNYKSTPLTYENGIISAPSNIIRIINTSDVSTSYKVYLTSTKDNITGLSDSKVYISINGEEGVLLSSLIDGLSYTSTINKGEEQILNIKVWLASEYITDDDINKSLYLKLKIKEE